MQSRIGQLAQFDIGEQWPGRFSALVSRLSFGLVCTAAFVVIRSFVDLLAPTAGPFALIYPLTLIATLFGGWRSGLVTQILSFGWAWFVVLPPSHVNSVVHGSISRLLVNAVSVLIVLLLAQLFRAAVHKSARQLTAAMDELRARELSLRELNESLEAQVAERTRELSQTWNLTPDLLGILNTDGYFELTNPAGQALLGWPEEQIRTTKFFEFIHPDDLDRTFSAWDQLNQGEPVLRFENRYRRPDGVWRWLSWVVVPEAGKFYCSARDITSELDARVSLRDAEDALRQSQKLEAVGQLTGGVAHDFNNLLTVILGSVNMLRRHNLSDAKREMYIEAIGSTADRAAKLTSQLLAFARRQSLDPVLFDASESLREVAGMIQTLSGSRIELDIQLPDHVSYILADRSQFDTAIINMSINARDAMKGEGRLSIAVDAVQGIPALRAHPPITGDFVAVSITDTGHGIAPEGADRIFEPFFTTKPVGEGTGLGLSQVFGFAKQSGGDIRVVSEPGAGASFTLYLPRTYADPTAAPAKEVDDPAADGEGVCVLVVEDNEQVGVFATQALRELGYDSVFALDAGQALAELEKDSSRFQVVFSDVVMPGMSGIELGAEVRRQYPDISVVLTSGYSSVLAQNGKQGFELLHKPYSVEQLARVLRKGIAGQRARRKAA